MPTIRYEFEPGYCGEIIQADGKVLCALRDEDAAYDVELARVRREHMQAQDYASLELRVLANDAAYVAAMERAYRI